MRGLSRTNLKYMRQAAAWPDPIGQQPVGQLPWGHVAVLLDKLDDPQERDWYAAAAEHGWSRKVLLNQIIGRLHQRIGAARSGSTWIHWWSPVASANWSTCSCVTSCHLLWPRSWPTTVASSSSPLKVRRPISPSVRRRRR